MHLLEKRAQMRGKPIWPFLFLVSLFSLLVGCADERAAKEIAKSRNNGQWHRLATLLRAEFDSRVVGTLAS